MGTHVIYSSTCCLILQGPEPGAAPPRAARSLSLMNVCERGVGCDKKKLTSKKKDQTPGRKTETGGWGGGVVITHGPPTVGNLHAVTQGRDEDPGR